MFCTTNFIELIEIAIIALSDSSYGHNLQNSNMDSDLNLADEVDFIKKDVNFAVDYIDVSKELPEKDGKIYINIQTKEKDRFCVELSSSGFTVVGKEYDCQNEDGTNRSYETVYSLLSNISSSYNRTFSDELARKLSNLQEQLEPN